MIPVLLCFGFAYGLSATCRRIQTKWVRITARIVGFCVCFVAVIFIQGLIVSAIYPTEGGVAAMSGIKAGMFWLPFACLMIWMTGAIGRAKQRKKAARQSAGLDALHAGNR